MNLYIRLRNGQPFEHPLFEENVRQAFPELDLTNLPADWARFTRYQQPGADVLPVGVFEVAEVKYTLSTDSTTWQDTWTTRSMTDAERNKKTRDTVASVAANKEQLTTLANEQIAATTGDVQTAWQTYLGVLQSITVTDPFAVELPTPPQLDEYGNLVTA